MKLFLDPFPFRNPENRSSIGDVIAEIVNGKGLDEATEGDLHGGGATSVKRKTPPATAKKFRRVPAPVVYTPTTPRGASPLKVSEACTDCTGDALKSLKAANAADLKDAPGAAGKAAHKRLHKTIGKVLKGTK